MPLGMTTHAYHTFSQPCLNKEAFEVSFFTMIIQSRIGLGLSTGKSCQTVSNPVYSPDLNPFNFFLFPKVKKQLRSIQFNDDNEMLTALEQVIDNLTKEDFRRLV